MESQQLPERIQTNKPLEQIAKIVLNYLSGKQWSDLKINFDKCISRPYITGKLAWEEGLSVILPVDSNEKLSFKIISSFIHVLCDNLNPKLFMAFVDKDGTMTFYRIDNGLTSKENNDASDSSPSYVQAETPVKFENIKNSNMSPVLDNYFQESDSSENSDPSFNWDNKSCADDWL